MLVLVAVMAGRLEALFSRCDIRGRGWIEIEEFKQICTDMGISMVQHSTVQSWEFLRL